MTNTSVAACGHWSTRRVATLQPCSRASASTFGKRSGCRGPTKTFLGFAVPRIIVLSTTANAKEANRIAKDLVERKLAACVNIVPISSHYRWKGKTGHHRECLIIIKSITELFVRGEGRILV